MKLSHLIDKYGEPKILIDHWRDRNIGLACFEVKQTLEWNENGLFLNNKQLPTTSIRVVQNIIDSWKQDNCKFAAIGYFSYNFKNILYPHIKFKRYNNNFPYLFFMKPEKMFKYKISDENLNLSKSLQLRKDILDIDSYSKIIKEIKNELYNGNVYQINYTMQKKYSVSISAFDIYYKLRQLSKPRHGYYFAHDNLNILSLSPEQFFKKEGNKIFSYPMKGTCPRSNDILRDREFKQTFKKSSKDKSEHLMIVDLIRNDIGKISKFGTVKVNNLFNIESYETVHHMVSEVSGELLDDITELKIVKALFPGGSVTGAPKESAMKIIDILENYNRNIYTGAIGYIKNNGDMNFNIPIRTMTINNGVAVYPVGGGIVWDSILKKEWEEAQLKSKILDGLVIKEQKMYN